MTPPRPGVAASGGTAAGGPSAPVSRTVPGVSARLAAWGCVALVVLSIAWEWWLAPLRPGGSLLVLKALPLALVLQGLLRGRRRSFQLASMLVLAYLGEGVVRGMTDPQLASTLGWIESALAAAVFAAVLAHVRAENRSTAALAASSAGAQAAASAGPTPRSP